MPFIFLALKVNHCPCRNLYLCLFIMNFSQNMVSLDRRCLQFKSKGLTCISATSSSFCQFITEFPVNVKKDQEM